MLATGIGGVTAGVVLASAVRVHIASIVRKLNVAKRADAIELFQRSGT